MTPAPLRLRNLALHHGTQAVVRDLSGSFDPGSLTALVGPNGAGKTTLLRAIAGLHRPAAGSIDRGVLHATDIALLPQGSQLDRGFPIACRDVVALGLYGRTGPFRALNATQRDAAEAALAAVGLAGYAGRPIGALSAGQFQRVMFARLIAQDAPVLLLDEPFAGIDVTTALDLLALVQRWHVEGRTVVAVLHDLELVRDAFPQTLLLSTAPVAWGQTTTVLTEANRQRAGLLLRPWAQPMRSAA